MLYIYIYTHIYILRMTWLSYTCDTTLVHVSMMTLRCFVFGFCKVRVFVCVCVCVCLCVCALECVFVCVRARTCIWLYMCVAVMYMSHGTHMNRTRHRWRSHVTSMNESWHTYEWGKDHAGTGDRCDMYESWCTWSAQVKESRHMYGWVMAHVWVRERPCWYRGRCNTHESWTQGNETRHRKRSHLARMDESCHTNEWVMSHE